MRRIEMKMSDSSFQVVHEESGKRTATFSGLTPNTVYYFKIFGYRGAGPTIGYKTDDPIQQVSIEAK
ncbi:MAG: fibronectin type III domain-containing protein [Bacteroidales bacterium]|nr:fibronectin type III domain-containing protein [Bacteroidales bacterium]